MASRSDVSAAWSTATSRSRTAFTASTGSLTLCQRVALTFTATPSLVMVSWVGRETVTVRRSTFTARST